MRMRFEAPLEHAEMTPFSTLVRIPFNPVETWPKLTKLRVRGSIRLAASKEAKAEFVTSLIRTSTLGYFLLVTGKMRKAGNLLAGSMVAVELEPVMDEAAAEAPPELARLLKQDRSVKKWFAGLNYSTRKYIADAILEPKSAETRARRAETWMERMMLTMEGEESPPPILQVAFRRQPAAQAAWKAMTANQRRLKLLSIFSCASPETRLKRVEYILDEALHGSRRGEKSSRASTRDDMDDM
jgi:uncharacterized protein YdeI (YjbR/CyaY-like superfamily)